jgi:hypothetical protein
MGIIPDFFSKKEDTTLEELKKQISSAKASLKKPAKTKPIKKKVKKAIKPSPKTPLKGTVSIFGGKQIRKYYFANKWYFALKDMAILAGITDLNKLKTQSNTKNKKTIEEIIFIIPALQMDPISGKDYEEDVECINYDNFMKFLRLAYSSGKRFPGAFPRWLEQVSKTQA